jgi:hypothetical protein
MREELVIRRRAIWDLHDFSTGRGLEIGPLHRAIVPRDEADVDYVDVLDREGLLEHYATDDSVVLDDIPEIDYPLIQPDGTALGLADAARAGAPYDWVVASHVIEHVPDVIGWLDEVGQLASDDARLVLVVPDRRYCFDVIRQPTSVGQMIQAHLDGDSRPSARAVYDYFSGAVAYDIKELWRGVPSTYADRVYSLAAADEKLEESLRGTYVDAHVWLWTPQSFLEQMHELRVTGRSSWLVERMLPTEAHGLEFCVVLRRVPRKGDASADHSDEVRSTDDRPDWLRLPEKSVTDAALEARIATLEAELALSRERYASQGEQLALRREKVLRLQRRVAKRARTIAQQERELAALRSHSWRARAAVLPVLRRLRRR